MQSVEPSVLTPSLPLTARLREVTRSRHLALHQAPSMRRIFSPDYSAPEYRTHLETMLGIVEPLERAAARSMEPWAAMHFQRRSERLCEDLCTMGASTRDVNGVSRYRGVQRMPGAGAPGYLYVALGSMLGGRLIARQLQSVLGTDAGVRYYDDGAGRADVRWTSFCADLNARCERDADDVVAVALATFDAFAEWLSQCP